MAVKTRAEIKAENASDLPDNITRRISPTGLRGQMDDIVDSMFLAEDMDQPGGPVGWPLPIDGDGEDLHGIDGVAMLRLAGVTAGQTVRLNYHTTPGDYGSGLFYGVTTGGPYTDNDGTTFVAGGGTGSAAWLRVWDGLSVHVGWWGAKCDHTTDDYDAVYQALKYFTDGRAALRSGVLNVGPGFAFGTPLIYGGSPGISFKIQGDAGTAHEPGSGSFLKYIGPATEAALIFYGANQASMHDVNLVPGLAYCGILNTADNTYNHTLVSPITAGIDRIVTPSGTPGDGPGESVYWLQAGCFLAIDAGGDNFEVIYVSAVDATVGTFTADFRKDHAAGVQVGGIQGAIGLNLRRCTLRCPAGPVPAGTVLALDMTTPTTGQTFTTNQSHNLRVGMAVRVDQLTSSEILYVTEVPTPTTFVADYTLSHVAGAAIIYPTAAFLAGNRILGTVQVSEMAFEEVYFAGTSPVTTQYCGFRIIGGGNVKNVTMNTVSYIYLKVGFAFEGGNGQLLINGCVGVCEDTIFVHNGGELVVTSLEDESGNAYMLRGGAGSSPLHATFIGACVQGSRPANDELVNYAGSLTCIGCQFLHSREPPKVPPIINLNGIRTPTYPGALTLINCYIANATASGANSDFIHDGANDVIALGDGKLTMMNCIGGEVGTGINVPLPNIFPPLTRWQNTATYDPPSLAAGAVDTAQTMTVSSAALGDLVEASFSLDLQGIALRAWVSAADTVKYQFSNPTTGGIDLGSGTVKCRVKK